MGQRRASPTNSPHNSRHMMVASAIEYGDSNNYHLSDTAVRRRLGGEDDDKKVHHRSCRESLIVCIFVKPQFLIRVVLFSVVAVCSLSLAFRLHSSAVRSLNNSIGAGGHEPYNYRDKIRREHDNHRILFQNRPTILHVPSLIATTATSSRETIWNDAGYVPRPRVVGCYWPDNYDDFEVEEELQEDRDESKQEKSKTEKGKPTPNANSNSMTFIPLKIERLDANLIRPLTDRTIVIKKKALKAQLHLENSKDYTEERTDPFEEGDCVAQHPWQLQSFPNCNAVHEQALGDIGSPKGDMVKFLTYGYWRDVWMVRDNDWEPLALKTIRYEHEYVDRNYDRHRRDAVAMEHLTSSPNVLSIYSFCGNTGIFEYATGGSLEDAIWYSNEPEWNSTEKLVVAYQVASGIADVHNSDMEGRPSIAHTDITPSQFVFVNKVGRFLLNDFNRCRFIRWNKKENKTCPFQVGNNPGTFRSPEEYAYKGETEKIDVYSMGNIFYTLLEKTYPFEDQSKKKAQSLIMSGERPRLSDANAKSKDESTQALVKAMNMCWIHDPEKRATAREVEHFLDTALARLGVHGKPT